MSYQNEKNPIESACLELHPPELPPCQTGAGFFGPTVSLVWYRGTLNLSTADPPCFGRLCGFQLSAQVFHLLCSIEQGFLGAPGHIGRLKEFTVLVWDTCSKLPTIV